MIQLHFPWAGESGARPLRYTLDWFDFLSAYAAVCKRFNDAMQAEQRAHERTNP